MNRYKVYWTERHSKYVEARNEDEAMNKALSEADDGSCDYQTVDACDHISAPAPDGPDDMSVAHAAAEERILNDDRKSA